MKVGTGSQRSASARRLQAPSLFTRFSRSRAPALASPSGDRPGGLGVFSGLLTQSNTLTPQKNAEWDFDGVMGVGSRVSRIGLQPHTGLSSCLWQSGVRLLNPKPPIARKAALPREPGHPRPARARRQLRNVAEAESGGEKEALGFEPSARD